MKNKIFTTLILGMFALVFLVGGVDAATFTITDLNAPLSVDETQDSFSFTFTVTYTGTSEGMVISFDDSITTIGNISIPDTNSLNGSVDESQIIAGVISGISDYGGQTVNVVINGSTTGGSIETATFSTQINDVSTPASEIPEIQACSLIGNSGDLRVKKISFDNQGFSGTVFGKDDVWFLLDEIDFEIEIKNYGSEEIEDIEVQWGIYDTSADEWMIELDDEKDFDLKDGKSNTITGSFTIDNMDLDFDELSDGDNYRFYVIAIGTIDDDTATETCVSDYKTTEIVIEDDFVVLSEINVQDTATCNEEIQITAKVWNIGEDEQDDVIVKIYNNELGISERIEFSSIDEFDYETLDVLIKIPKDADEKTYLLIFEIYDEDGDIYENDYDDDESRFTTAIKIEGNCGAATDDAIVTASLTSGGKAGQPLVITSTITNTGSNAATYTINAANYAFWANSADVSPQTIIVDSGSSKQVIFTFDVKNDASGSNNFEIEVLSENQLVITQPVSVQIEESGFNLFNNIVFTPFVIASIIIAILIIISIIVLIIRLIK
jgi:hypothetical protein